MATVICRRCPGRFCQAAIFSVPARCTKKNILEDGIEDSTSNQGTNYTKFQVNSRTMLESLEYQVLYNPSAYFRCKKSSSYVTEDSEDDLVDHHYSGMSAKQIHNMYSVTCSRSLSSSKNTLLELALHKPIPLRPRLVQSAESEENQELEESLIETFNTKEDPRAFQKKRPDYVSLCYDRCKLFPALSVDEGELILKNLSVMKGTLTPEILSDYFYKLSCLPVDQIPLLRADTRFAMLCRYSVDSVHSFSLSDLINILKAFVCLNIPPTHTMLNVYEVELCCRVWDMNVAQILLVADLWRCLGRVVPRYLEISYSYINLHWKDLSLPQLVQLVYIIGEGRTAPKDVMEKLESLLLKYIDLMNLDEIGAVCLGFFKSRCGLSEHLMQKIGDKVSSSMEEMSNYALVSVLKMFRFTHVDHLQFLKRLGQVVPQRIPTIGTQGVMHISLACAALHYLDEGILNAVAETIPSRTSYCRSKDLAKFLWSFGVLNYEPPNGLVFYSSLTDQIRRKMHEFEKFPEHLLTCLLALAFAQQFPFDLIDFALSDKFVKKAIKGTRFELKKDLFTLDGSVGIECPTYTGNRLKPKLQQEVSEMLWDFATKELNIKPEIVEAATLLGGMLGGPEYVKSHMILPHTRSSDLEVHLDANGQALPFNKVSHAPEQKLKAIGVHLTEELINQLLSSKRATSEKMNSNLAVVKQRDVLLPEGKSEAVYDLSFSGSVPITDNLVNILTDSNHFTEMPTSRPETQLEIMKLAIQVSNKNHFAYASKHLLGLHSLKRRQLRQLGYIVIEVPFWEWVPLLRRTRSEKLAYLHQKVFSSVN